MIINFDRFTNQLNTPLLVLSTKNYRKLGVIHNAIPTVSSNDNEPNEMSFRVFRYLDDIECKLWNKIDNLKLVWLKESNEYYEIKIQPSEDEQEYKDIICTSLCEAELSQLNIYNTEINTEEDIERDDYTIPTVFYNENNKENSLLNRILEKAPHYTIGHVDESLNKIQRAFSFDDISIYDALGEISEEIGCIFKFNSATRTINVYDLYQYCKDCGKRNDTSENTCPECGSTNVNLSYGKRTNVFFSTDNVIEDISIEYNIDEYKNCYKLKSGDDLFDATIRNINPNGTDYIYNITQLMQEDMSEELAIKLNEYNDKYSNIIDNYSPALNEELKTSYNNLVSKYNSSLYANYQYDDEVNRVLTNNSFLGLDDISSYDSFANVYYDAIDFCSYLESKLMPSVEIETTYSYEEIKKITSSSLSPISLSSVSSSTSKSTVESAIKNYVKILISGNYKVEAATESFTYKGVKDDGTEYGTWTGAISITKYGNEEDSSTTSSLTVEINDDYQNFLEQKIDKALVGDDNENEIGSVYNVLNIEYDDDFISALKLYGKSRLKSFKDSYQAGLDVLIELGQGAKDSEFYGVLYVPYQKRCSLIAKELSLRTKEINLIEKVIDCLEETKSALKDELNIESFLGKDLWLEFCSYRREATYENENYISDGLDNAELIKNAKHFFDLAKNDLYKSGKVGISISGNLITFMSIKEFLPLLEDFDTGIWVKVKVHDNIYTVRLSNFEIDFSDKNNSSVIFTDVAQAGKSPTQQLIDSMKSISVDLPSLKKQVDNGKDATNFINTWRKDGLDLTNQEILSNAKQPTVVYDRNGILVTSIDDITEQTSPEQIKIVNSTIAFTDDNWESVKTALGKFIYVDPETQEQKVAFGINGEVLIGHIILGESLGIYSGDNSLKFDENGLVINATPDENGVYKRIIDIQVDGESLFYVDENGDIVFKPLNSLRSEMSSVAQEAINGITIGGRNLIIRSDETKVILNEDGTESENDYYVTSDYISLVPNSDYMFTKTSSTLVDADVGGYFKYAWYSDVLLVDEEDNFTGYTFIGFSYHSENEFKWTAPSDAYYIRISYPADCLVQFEKGNKATAYSLAPEDVEQDYSDKIIKLTSEITTVIEQTETSIINEVSEKCYTKDDTDSLVYELSTSLTQTKNSFEMTFTQIANDITNINGTVNDNYNKLKNYIRFEGGTITLGEENNPLILTLSNDRMSFCQNTNGNEYTEVAYVSDNKLWIYDGEFLNSLKIGRWVFIPRTNGNLSFTYI